MYLLVAGVSKLPAQIHFLRNNSLYCFIYFNLFSFFLKCDDCLKWRVCYASRVLTKNEILELESELDNISFSCGSCFQDIEDYEGGIFDHVYVNDKLTRASPMEAPYYVTFSDPLCYYCGSEHDLTSTSETYPICVECKEQGNTAKNKVKRAFTKKNK